MKNGTWIFWLLTNKGEMGTLGPYIKSRAAGYRKAAGIISSLIAKDEIFLRTACAIVLMVAAPFLEGY